MTCLRNHIPLIAVAAGLCLFPCANSLGGPRDPGSGPRDPADVVLDAEARRIATIERISPAVVCIQDQNRRGSGSGVLIDREGYGLTNYHVVASMLKERKGWGGLDSGELYEMEVLGIDVTGDVAMFRLIAPEPGFVFPSVTLGDSDAVRVGDTALVLGNPFSLSEDYTPSVSLGVVTGVHRYQWGVKGNLVYSDCIQVDAPVNPGNSGGPLFNADGEVIGINGRISINTRGRYNVGFGYAISVNQIKRFIPALRAGLLARHGTWQAVVDSHGSGVAFAQVRPGGPADHAGIRVNDDLLQIDGVEIRSPNQVASMLGTYPQGWPVRMRTDRKGTTRDVIVRLDPVQPHMRHPFKVDRNVNLREVKRVLHGFRGRTLGSDSADRPKHWSWNVERRFDPSSDGTEKPPQRFECSQDGDRSIRMLLRREDGSEGQIVEYDANRATQRTGPQAEEFDVTPDAAMVLSALYILQRRFLEPVERVDYAELTHAGADAVAGLGVAGLGWYETAGDDHIEVTGLGSPHGSSAPDVVRLLEVIEKPLADGVVARFAFDSETFDVRRISVSDGVSGRRATVEFHDHGTFDTIRWPRTMVITGDGPRYRDILANPELSP